MKVFWSLMLVLALAAGGLLFVRGRGGLEGATDGIRASSLPRAEAPAPDQSEDAPAGPLVEPPGGAALETPAEPRPEGADAGNWETGAEADPLEGSGGVSGASEDSQASSEALPESADADATGSEEAAENEVAENAPAENASLPEHTPAESAPGAAVAGEPAESPEGAAREPEPAPSVEASGAPALDAESGVLLLNGRHKVVGDGTAAAPFVVDWDMLVALESEYEPKTEGKKQVPEWIKALDGKHVSLTGFIAFPFIAPSADECMVMLNQWDGCCIGVPPTPYDAVEVKLAESLDLREGVINYGTITGVFRTDPYLVNGWLIGLYVMDDAVLTKAGGKNIGGF